MRLNLRDIYSKYNPEPPLGILWISWHTEYCKFLVSQEPDNANYQHELKLCKGMMGRWLVKHWETTIAWKIKNKVQVDNADLYALDRAKNRL